MQDTAYFNRRAEAELAMAQSAASTVAAKAHSTLAGYYQDLATAGVMSAPRPAAADNAADHA